jgi:hypothetical protein
MTDISIKWVQAYIDSLLRIAGIDPNSAMGRAAMSRADHAMDLVISWRDHGPKAPPEKQPEPDAHHVDYGYRVRYLHHRLRHRRPPHRHQRVGLLVNGDLYELHPKAKVMITMDTLSPGHTDDIAVVFLDQNSNPMLTTPTLDAPATWTQAPSGSGVDTLTVAPDTLSAALAALTPGTDTVSVALAVGGKPFAASLGVTISPAPQVLTSIALQGTVS